MHQGIEDRLVLRGNDSINKKNEKLELEKTTLIEEPIKDLNEISKEHSNDLASPEKEDSYDWSLGKIPAFKKDNLAKDKGKKFIKMVSSVKKKPPPESKIGRFLVLLLFILLVFAIIFYLLNYYESKQEIFDRELARYQIAQDVEQSPLIKSPQDAVDLYQEEINIVNHNILPEAELVNDVPKEDFKDLLELGLEKDFIEKMPEQKKPEGLDETSEKPEPLETNIVELKPQKLQKLQDKTSAEKDLTDALEKPTQNIYEASRKASINIKSTPSKEMLAYKAYQNKDFVMAEKLYLEAIAMNSRSLSAFFGLGAIAISRGEYNKALSFYKRAEEINPNHPKVQKALAQLLSLAGSDSGQRQDLKSLISEHPNDPNLPFALGNWYAKNGNWVQAQKHYFNAYKLDNEKFDFALNLAVSLDHLGEYSLAKKYYKIALSLGDNSQEVNFVVLNSVKSRLLALKTFLLDGVAE